MSLVEFLFFFFQQEVFRAKKKRDRKGRHGGDTALEDERLEAELSLIRRPQLSDILPCVLARVALRAIVGVPSSVHLVIEWYYNWRTVQEQDQDDTGFTSYLMYTVSQKTSTFECLMKYQSIFTAQSSYASAVLGIVILSVTRVLCNETKEHTANILTPHERAINLVF